MIHLTNILKAMVTRNDRH